MTTIGEIELPGGVSKVILMKTIEYSYEIRRRPRNVLGFRGVRFGIAFAVLTQSDGTEFRKKFSRLFGVGKIRRDVNLKYSPSVGRITAYVVRTR